MNTVGMCTARIRAKAFAAVVAVAIALVLVMPGPAWLAPRALAAADDVALKPVGTLDLKGLVVGLYAPDATLKSPVEALQATQSWTITGLTVVINTNPGLCDEHTVAEILEMPNQASAPDGPDCIFGLLLTVQTAQRAIEIAVECGDWVDNAAPCWGFGPTGDFRLVREGDKAPSSFRLIFPGPGSREAARSPNPADGVPSAASPETQQRHGLFLDTILNAKKEAKGDLWLAWTGQTVELAFKR